MEKEINQTQSIYTIISIGVLDHSPEIEKDWQIQLSDNRGSYYPLKSIVDSNNSVLADFLADPEILFSGELAKQHLIKTALFYFQKVDLEKVNLLRLNIKTNDLKPLINFTWNIKH